MIFTSAGWVDEVVLDIRTPYVFSPYIPVTLSIVDSVSGKLILSNLRKTYPSILDEIKDVQPLSP